jgi:hypothetical protein
VSPFAPLLRSKPGDTTTPPRKPLCLAATPQTRGYGYFTKAHPKHISSLQGSCHSLARKRSLVSEISAADVLRKETAPARRAASTQQRPSIQARSADRHSPPCLHDLKGVRSDRSHSNCNGAQVTGVEKQERQRPIEIHSNRPWISTRRCPRGRSCARRWWGRGSGSSSQ